MHEKVKVSSRNTDKMEDDPLEYIEKEVLMQWQIIRTIINMYYWRKFVRKNTFSIKCLELLKILFRIREIKKKIRLKLILILTIKFKLIIKLAINSMCINTIEKMILNF